MNEQELVKFIEWLPNNVDAFRGKNPEEIAGMLNEMAQTEEGAQTLNNLINQYKQAAPMFKSGGKLDSFVSKFQKGGKNTTNKNRQIEESTLRVTDYENALAKYHNMWKNGDFKQKLSAIGGLLRMNFNSAREGVNYLLDIPRTTQSYNLPLRSGTDQVRSYERKVYPRSNKIVDIISKPGGSIERITNNGDTTFVNNYVDPQKRKYIFTRTSPLDESGNDRYSEYTADWKEYGVYSKGGEIPKADGGTKVNPKDSTAINKALKNEAGNRGTPWDTLNTAKLVADSLKKVGYDPIMVDRYATPIYNTARQEIANGQYPHPEDETGRQMNLHRFIDPKGYYWKNGGINKIQKDTIGDILKKLK